MKRTPEPRPTRRDRKAQMFQHGPLEEQLRMLERACDADPRNRPRCHAQDGAPTDAHLPALWAQIAGADIQERALTGAVLADDGEELAFCRASD